MTTAAFNKKSRPRLARAHVHVLGMIGVLALAGIGHALGYAPSVRAQNRAEQQHRTITKANDEVSATAIHLEAANIEREAILAEIGTRPAGGDDPVAILTDAATAHALTVHNIVASEVGVSDGIVRTRVVVQASGTFSDITGFIAGVWQIHPGMATDGFSIMPDPLGGRALSFQASLSVYAPQAASPVDSEEE